MTYSPKPAKLLLVDDLAENLVALEALLGKSDLELLKANSGREALELLLEHDIALALIDVQMPELDGFELAELMRGSPRTQHIPIIFVTAGAWERNRLFRGYDAGAVDFLFKPIDPHILRHKVGTFVSLYHQRLEIAEQLQALQRSEAETRSLKDELARTLELNETFVAAVSHDLKNPVNAILIATDLLLARCQPAERRILDRARSSARRMANMIDQLFDLSRARLAGGVQIAPQPNLDLARLVDEAVAEVAAASPEHTCTFTHTGDTRGTWDPERIARVVSNLVGNAVRHGATGTPVTVHVDGEQRDQVTLEVRNGGEIPPELLPVLFAPFGEGKHGRKRGEGLGLGLFIVSEIVTAHGGKVTVRSGEGSTTFNVALPRHASAAAEPEVDDRRQRLAEGNR
ncbi:MAG TPA: hybrid sensor histidine kinase/response regulator [Polyangiaceae bacterium]|jgi:signal transduction histidine kinase|nr:hybrid sensor histidine kinase/response regulator [Polyangiaceae bacterium]